MVSALLQKWVSIFIFLEKKFVWFFLVFLLNINQRLRPPRIRQISGITRIVKTHKRIISNTAILVYRCLVVVECLVNYCKKRIQFLYQQREKIFWFFVFFTCDLRFVVKNQLQQSVQRPRRRLQAR